MYKRPITMSCDWSMYQLDDGVLYQIEGDYRLEVGNFDLLIEAFNFLSSTGYPVQILSEIKYADDLHDKRSSG